MRMAFGSTRLGNPDKFSSVLKFLYSGGSNISHAGSQSSLNLEQHVSHWPLIRSKSFHAFGHIFFCFLGLCVAICASCFHGSLLSHASILLVSVFANLND